MTRRIVSFALAAGVAALLLPMSAAEARCYGDPKDIDTIRCNATCAVYSVLENVAC